MNEPEIIALISQLTAEKEKLEKQVEQGANYCIECGAEVEDGETE